MNIILHDLVGKPFSEDGTGPDSYNCWHLVKEVFHRFGVDVPDYRISALNFVQIEQTYKRDVANWIRVNDPPVPALITMKLKRPHVNHFAVFIGNGEFIHAYQGAGQVCIDSIYGIRGNIWLRIIEGYYIPGWIGNVKQN